MKNELTRLLFETEQYADSYGMLNCTDIIVGFSGGSDSSLLLFLLSHIAKKHNIRLTAAHINHMFRGDEADRDEEFCKRTCEGYSIPFRSLRIDVGSLARDSGLGDEECARNVRYGFLTKLKQEIEADGAHAHIATAHNATDNAETVLFNLTRGASLTGVCGIPPVRDGYIIRPILQLSKEQVNSWCSTLKLDYVTDRTNSETLYTRNKIRHNILPVLREINPSLEDAVLRAGESMRADSEYLSELALDAYNKAKHGNTLLCDKLSSFPDIILSRVLCRFLDDLGAGYSNAHIRACTEKTRNSSDFSISLIGKKRLCIKNKVITVQEDTREKKHFCSWQMPLGEGKNIMPDGSLIYLFSKKEDAERIKTQNVYKLFIQQTLSGDTIDNVFIARSRREGDVIISGGHTHKIKKLLSDKKIPACERDLLPMVIRDGAVAWIPSVRTADGEGRGEQCVYAIYLKL